jgi:carbon-monoxide dehydrogenase small subunit
MEISLTINGKEVKADIKANTLLSTFIREHLNLTGTHIGCDTSQCGACAIHLNGDAVKSCAVLAAQADGAVITTIEGIANGDELHPMQQAFHENHGLQCGYCTPGMVMSSIKLVENNPSISEEEIRKGLEGNICRCTGYHNIVKSIKQAATVMGG